MATSTIPNGANPVKVATIFSKKATIALESSKFLTSSTAPVLGSISVNDIVDNIADSTQTSSMRKKNKTAGSGSLLPAFSIKSKKRVMAGFFSDCLLFIFTCVFICGRRHVEDAYASMDLAGTLLSTEQCKEMGFY